MGGLASAPGIRNIGDPINLSTPQGILFVGATGDFQEDAANFTWNINNKFVTVNGIKLGLSNQAPTDVSGTVVGRLAGGTGGVTPPSGINVTAIGAGALQGMGDTSTDNTAVGAFTLNVANFQAIQNTAIGSKALMSLINGTQNTAIGYLTFSAITSSLRNVGIGTQAGQNVSSGNDNIAIGYQALQGAAGSNGANNVAIGNLTMHTITGAIGPASNVAVGHQALTALTNGSGNTVVGGGAGSSITTGANNIAIGQSAMTVGNYQYAIAIGQNVQVGGNNSIAIGTAAGIATAGLNQIEIGNGVHTQTTLHGQVVNSGNIMFGTDNSFDIGASGTSRPRSIFAGTKLQIEANAGFQLTNQTSTAAALVGTLNNSPVAGDPTFWLPVLVNGVPRSIPCW